MLTYCNPLPLPSYQRGKASIKSKADEFGWLHEIHRDFREMADPTVIRFKDKWYLFPSCGSLWYSEDMVNWEFYPIEPFDIGYAPTVVQKGEYLYLTACGDTMWRAGDPLGPWECLGNIKNEKGERFEWFDPMLFVDDDGVMYCYHGLGKDGIYAVKLKEDDPTSFDGPRVNCFAFNPEHVWERYGEHNQHVNVSYIEGSWMTKHKGKYYLQYSAPGTEWKSYSIGCYTSDGPMGPFKYQDKSPILTHKSELVNGCAHHSIVEGPDGNLWCFYTTLIKVEHMFERRIGMDPVGFNAMGNMFVSGPTDTPQLAPGLTEKPYKYNGTDLIAVSSNCIVRASSYVEGHEPVYAVDDYIRTWWQAGSTDEPQWLSVDLNGIFEISASRTMFADRGLDYEKGVLPGPYKYIIEGSLNGKNWELLCDKSDNLVDRHISYDTWDSSKIRFVRLKVLSAPPGMSIAVWEFTVFGKNLLM